MTSPIENVSRADRKIHSLQILRGLAAALVVIAHSIEHPLAQPYEGTLRTGRIGVEMFFVISGIIIAEVAGSSSFDPKRFIIHRFFRVAPLYWATTFLVVACSLWFPGLLKTTTFDLVYVVKSFLFIPAPIPNDEGLWQPFYKLGWTLNYEAFFYVVMVSLFWCRTALQRALGLTLILGALIAVSFVPRDQQSIFFYYANLNVLPFLVGVWLSWLRGRGVLNGLPRPAIAGLCAATIACFVLFYTADIHDRRPAGAHLLMTLTASLPLVLGLAVEKRVDWRPYALLETIGDNSYSLYLVHMFIVGAAVAVLHRIGLQGPMFWAVFLPGTFILNLVAANLSYRFVELPINRFGKTFGRRPGPARDPAVGTAG